uniref:Uncharacterized protein n=1 Tax=Sphaerodactylus townsendi TaxID=933632 RepID=A0ACB8E8I9_9SAUR
MSEVEIQGKSLLVNETGGQSEEEVTKLWGWGTEMERMDFEGKTPKKYCMKKKHVAIICGVIIAVGLILGLALGLSRPDCHISEDGQVTTESPTRPTTGSPTRPTTRSPTSPTTRSPTSPTTESLTSPPTEDTDPCPALNDDSGAWTDFRLPIYVKPLHYDLELTPEMEADRYTGQVTILIRVENTTRHLWLHLRETKITEMPLLKTLSDEPITLNQCFEYKPQEYIVVEAAQELTSNSTYRLTMKFQGYLNGSLVGFYRTTYIENGITK